MTPKYIVEHGSSARGFAGFPVVVSCRMIEISRACNPVASGDIEPVQVLPAKEY